MALKTEFQFRLPRGWVDGDGNVHKTGVMRLATARDEIVPLQDYRVQSNRAYLVIVLLSRVIKKIGDIDKPTVTHIENLFSTDLAYLQEFYRRINEEGSPRVNVSCPKCDHKLEIDMISGALVSADGEGGPGHSGQG
jgi:phage FluMu protein gp41